ncbi:MAG: sugar phosphate isomerase/epimerase [Treponema sp.]|nr:sugar phosphate isomerase/epimerase [Treponema sp.]
MKKALDAIAPWHFTTVEYYSEGVSAGKVSRLMEGRRSIFLAGALQKAAGLNPCALDKDVRDKAVAELGECFRFARQAGAGAVMLSSGPRPEHESDDPQCLLYLRDSLERLHKLEPELPILLEPGDRDVEYRHLLGHTPVSVEFVAVCRREGLPLGLIFDISHVAQLGEDLHTAWAVARSCCDHVHLANCVLERRHPLYGDKHPFLGVPGGVYSHQDARNFLSVLQEDPLPLTVSLEVICPLNEPEDRFFSRLVSDTRWFFDWKPGTPLS